MPLILSFKKPNFVLNSGLEGLIESTELFRYSGTDLVRNLTGTLSCTFTNTTLSPSRRGSVRVTKVYVNIGGPSSEDAFFLTFP